MSKRTRRENDLRLYKNLTVLDFADSPYTSKRIPKGKLSTQGIIQSETSADALEIEFEDNQIQAAHNVANDSTPDPENVHVYNNYQLDIWFLISEHIKPEDVYRFALICQNTRYVVSTAKFWFHMYKKFYTPRRDLPVRLQPACMVRLGGLRACVIRSLFYTYKPFVERPRFSPELCCLLKLKCSAVWYKQVKDYWTLGFKFSKYVPVQQRHPKIVDNWEDSKELITAFTDINANSEEGCYLLIVITDRFFPPPDFKGNIAFLSKIIQPLSQNLRTFKLEMTYADYSGKTIGNVSYDPVRQCKLLRWWDREYDSYLG